MKGKEKEEKRKKHLELMVENETQRSQNQC
jgi:hypothetical protein